MLDAKVAGMHMLKVLYIHILYAINTQNLGLLLMNGIAQMENENLIK